MQLFAYDDNRCAVPANKAKKKRDYVCIECGSAVRLRGGLHRQHHFFHTQPERSCRLNGKSMAHLQVQCYLERLLPYGTLELEARFPEIGRIADAAWHERRIIFEVQCSPISGEEIRMRNSDYASQGYQVVWILHDNRYNQPRLTAAEMSLRGSPFYYTNINAQGEGMIYDQFALYKGGFRSKSQGPYTFAPDSPRPMPPAGEEALPRSLAGRMQSWPFYFEGDLFSLAIGDQDLKDKLTDMEKGHEPLPKASTLTDKMKAFIHSWIFRPYRLFFYLLLERASR